MGFLCSEGGRFAEVAERLGIPADALRRRSHKIGAKRQVLEELNKSDKGLVA